MSKNEKEICPFTYETCKYGKICKESFDRVGNAEMNDCPIANRWTDFRECLFLPHWLKRRKVKEEKLKSEKLEKMRKEALRIVAEYEKQFGYEGMFAPLKKCLTSEEVQEAKQ
jgi:hypothetical protein